MLHNTTKDNINSAAEIARIKKQRSRSYKIKSMQVNMMLAPAFVLLFIFSYIPMYGVIMAFKDFNMFDGIINSPWAGFYYFKYFLTDPSFWKVMRNTIYINLWDLLWSFPAPIILAIMLNELRSSKFKKTIQTITYMPNFLSWVVVAGMIISILSPGQDGMVNVALNRLFGIEPIYFMSQPRYFLTIYIVSGIWKGVGFSSIVYMAALAGIDESLYEAAMIDGAARLKCVRYITIPCILPYVMIFLIFAVAGIFNIGFERIFLLQNSLTREISDVISTYTYSLGIQKAQYSRTAAIGLVQSFLALILVYSSNYAAKKVTGYGFY